MATAFGIMATPELDTELDQLEKELWSAADARDTARFDGFGSKFLTMRAYKKALRKIRAFRALHDQRSPLED